MCAEPLRRDQQRGDGAHVRRGERRPLEADQAEVADVAPERLLEDAPVRLDRIAVRAVPVVSVERWPKGADQRPLRRLPQAIEFGSRTRDSRLEARSASCSVSFAGAAD